MPNEILKERNIESVLKAAESCFRVYGIGSTTIDMIAKQSKISGRSIFRYFGSKNNLTYIVADRFSGKYYGDMERMIHNAYKNGTTGIEQVRNFYLCLCKFFDKDRSSVILMSELEIYLYKNRYMKELLDKNTKEIKRIQMLLQSAICNGIKDKTIKKDIDAEVTVIIFYNTFMGLASRDSLSNDYLAMTERRDIAKTGLYDCANMLIGHLKGNNQSSTAQ